MRRAVVYTRISQDDGTALGVGRQRKDCEQFCDRKRWQVVEVITDNDVSAFSGRRRPGYERLLELIESSTIDVVVAWHPDRLHRSPRELEHFIDVVEASGVAVATVTAGDVDLATPDGRLLARLVGAVARKESEDKSRRLKRKHRELAENGRVSGGGVRPFGFKPDRVHHDRREAALVREAARRVIAGESLYAIAQDWTRRGVPTVTGAKWTTTHLRTFLMAPRIAGLREYEGAYFPAVWRPIIAEDEWHQVCRTLRARSKGRTRPPRAYLLSGGLARCGKCGAALVAAPRPTGRAYACLVGHGGCNGVSIMAEPVEDLVVEAVMEVVDTPELAGRLERPGTDPDADVDVLRDVEARLEELAELYADGSIGRGEWLRARARLEERRDAAEAALVEKSAPSPALEYAGRPGALRRAWPKLSLDQRRAIVAEVVDAVVVASAGRRGGRRVDLGRVDVRWRA